MAFLMNILGDITGANKQKHAGDMAQGAANQASDAQNQLIQKTLLPIYQQMLASYNSGGYQQLGQGMGQDMLGLLGQQGQGLGNTSGDLINALMSSQGRDNATGIDGQGITDSLLQYLQNPQNTASSQVNGQALAQYMDPNTNLAGAAQGAQGYFGNPGQTNMQAQGHANSNYLNDTQGTNTNTIGGAANQYLMDGRSNVAGSVGMGALDQLAGPTNLSSGVGQQAMAYYQNEAQHGLDPSVSGAQINNYNNSSQRDINSMRNSLGAGIPNLAGTLSDLGERQFENRANLSSQLAGQDQGFRDNAMAQGFGAGQAIDNQQAGRAMQSFGIGQGVNSADQSRFSQAFQQGQGMDQNTQAMLSQAFSQGGQMDQQTAQMLQQYFQNAGNLDTQNFGRESAAQGTANNMDQQIQQMLTQGYGTANGQQQQQLANMNLGNNTEMGIMSMLQQYLGGGQQYLTGAAGGVNGLQQQYGNAAAGASQNAQQMFDRANQTNQQFIDQAAKAAASGAG